MVTILDEREKTKVYIDDEIKSNFAILEEKLGTKKSHRIYKTDKTTFRVNIDGLGYLPSVSSLLYEEAHGGYLLFWSNKTIAFRTDSLLNKIIHLNFNDDNCINIKFDENLKQGME